jgi:hypothetical protein
MTLHDALLPIFFLLIGVPCVLPPRRVQSFVLRFNERMGSLEGSDSFRCSEKYVRRLRRLGSFTILAAVFIVLIDVFAEDIVRAVI